MIKENDFIKTLFRRERPDAYFSAEVGHDKDFLASALAYHLDLRGPAETVATSCSSSLVAVARAAHAIRLGLCEVALCGGASFSAGDPHSGSTHVMIRPSPAIN